jgi:hypothetical protein
LRSLLPTFVVAVLGAVALPASAAQPLDLELSSDPFVGDLTGSAFGRGYGGRFDSLRGLQLDSIDVGLPLGRALRLVGRLEVGADDQHSTREVVMGAFEVGFRYQPRVARGVRPFVSAGAGWVGGGIMTPDTVALWDHAFDPQFHVQAGLDLRLGGGWKCEVRVPFRYLWGQDVPLAAATVGFRHAM